MNNLGNSEQVEIICRIDKGKYTAVTDGTIRSNVLVLTRSQRKHIIKRRGQKFFDEYFPFFAEVIEDPDYIFKDPRHANSAIVSKTISNKEANINIVIRLAIDTDEKGLHNSIITVIRENDKRYLQRLRNNTPVYKRIE